MVTQEAFSQVRVRESQRDALRFYWVSNLDLNEIETNCFTPSVFGLKQSPFTLEGTL